MNRDILSYLLRISALLAGLLVGLSGCTDESLVSSFPVKEGEKVKLRVYVDIQKQQSAQTRNALNDDYMDLYGLYILVFDTNNILVDLDKVVSIGTAENPMFFTNLTSTSQPRNVYIIANAAGVVESRKEAWVVGGTTLAEIENDLLTDPLPLNNGVITAMPHPHPMIGFVACSGISSSTSIGTSGTQTELTRTTAKVEIVNKTPEAAGTWLLGAHLAQVPLQSYLFADAAGQESIARANYDPDILGAGNLEPAVTLYSYESAVVSKDNTFAVIKVRYKGAEGYHRVNLVNASKQQLPLKRNYKYQVQIHYIGSAGYATADEAIRKPATEDIRYDISVFDSHSHDIISNGEYYLGVSNSELVIYDDADLFNLTATTLMTDAPASVPEATITVESGNISLAGFSVIPSPGAGYREDIRINMPAGVFAASLKIRVGDLSKMITIRRYSYIPEPGGVIEEFHRSEFVSGQIEYDGMGWLKLSTSVSGSSDKADELDNPSGGLVIHAASNVGFENEVSDRTGTLYMARSNDQGRVKVMLKQRKLDIYRDKIQIDPYTYVGTFHRWYQTGERVIRIQPKVAGPTSKWTVVVVEGQDWIQLSTAQSPDPGLGTDPYGIGDNSTWTDNDIERNAQLRTDSVVVTGIGEKIYFRIGLKNQLPGGSGGNPRYGLVAVIHDKGNHFIFVRQGENPDFLMRKNDVVTQEPGGIDNPRGFTRDLAVPIAVYNLTDPFRADGWVDRGKNGYTFTDYPTQGGYYFQGQATRAYSATAVASDFQSTPSFYFSSPWNAGMETCPPGYRRFADTPNDQFIGKSNALAIESEIRQSLWLYPRDKGDDQANFQNTIRGYLADGFYDRREMITPSNGNYTGSPTQGKYSAVGSDVNIAFSGALYFNPYTHASVFFPEAGYMGSHSANGGKGVFRDKGDVGSYWTSSASSVNAGWSMQIGWAGVWAAPVVADNYLQEAGIGASIRCVREGSR